MVSSVVIINRHMIKRHLVPIVEKLEGARLRLALDNQQVRLYLWMP